MKLVIVTWNDAVEHAGWYSDPEISAFAVPLVRTVGWLFSQDDSIIRLVTSIGDGDKGGVQIIPAGMVRQIDELAAP